MFWFYIYDTIIKYIKFRFKYMLLYIDIDIIQTRPFNMNCHLLYTRVGQSHDLVTWISCLATLKAVYSASY